MSKQNNDKNPGATLYRNMTIFFGIFTVGLPIVFLLTKHYWAILICFIVCFAITLLLFLDQEIREDERAKRIIKSSAANPVSAVLTLLAFFVASPVLAAYVLALLLARRGFSEAYFKAYHDVMYAAAEEKRKMEQEKKQDS